MNPTVTTNQKLKNTQKVERNPIKTLRKPANLKEIKRKKKGTENNKNN